MAPTAVNEAANGTEQAATPKAATDASKEGLFNIFYSPQAPIDIQDGYKYDHLRPSFPEVDWPTLEPVQVEDRGFFADPNKSRLLAHIEAVGGKIKHINPTIGTEITGVDIRTLGPDEKDDLALLVAERGTVFFRAQELNIHEQLEFGRYFGPLHKHFTTPIPKEPGLEEVHVVYTDENSRFQPGAYTRRDLWHSDVTYELQPPALTSLKLYTAPSWGGDTHWASGHALYSSFSPQLQEYLSTLRVVHSSIEQAAGARAAGTHVRRGALETEHPLARVHPVTGLKSIFVNTGFSRRIVGVPKAESEAILNLILNQLASSPDLHVRFKWEENDLALWDNRVTAHAASFDYYPERRHALRVTPHGERPLSIKEYEEKYGKKAQAWISPAAKAYAAKQNANDAVQNGAGAVRGYSD